MVDEAQLVAVDSGLAPSTDGWFVVNVDDSAWLTNDAFGARCVFEADARVVRGQAGLDVHRFTDLGFTLAVIAPGQPSGLYHAESNQEDFLVLAGEYGFVGAGDGPCVLLMTGGRMQERTIVYPDSELARRHEAGVAAETSSASDAYAPFPHWRRGRPERWHLLPWA